MLLVEVLLLDFLHVLRAEQTGDIVQNMSVVPLAACPGHTLSKRSAVG